MKLALVVVVVGVCLSADPSIHLPWGDDIGAEMIAPTPQSQAVKKTAYRAMSLGELDLQPCSPHQLQHSGERALQTSSATQKCWPWSRVHK